MKIQMKSILTEHNSLKKCGGLSLREAPSCERQFIVSHGWSLRVLEVLETSEKNDTVV